MKKLLTIIIFLSVSTALFAQDTDFKSIHQMQLEYYNNLGLTTQAQFDSLNEFKLMPKLKNKSNCTLNKIVFGWHPYWVGSAYLNYQWNLLSDLSYFSYEVNANTGNPDNTHSWATADVIDSALANGVRVNLCVTLFSNHSTFFGNSTTQQTLIDNVISMVQTRGANGVNIDFEGVPSSQATNFTNFVVDFCIQMHTQIPGSKVSICLYSVDWNNVFDEAVLNNYIDYFCIMGYAYYYGGSSTAGPTGGLYSLTSSYNYNQSKSVSYYLAQGISNDKLVLGVPYYGYEWPTSSETVPSSTTGSGYSKTYKYVEDNTSGNYSNKLWEGNSFTPYYTYYSSGWYQCFCDDAFSLGKRYDMVNMRNIAGIGIWALGYDDTYTALWSKLEGKFTNCSIIPCCDTIYDTGGPAFDHYNDEYFIYTIAPTGATSLSLTFNSFALESGYDSIWIYDGANTTASLIGGYSGNTSPGIINSSGNALTIEFYSDVSTNEAGWEAIWQCSQDTTPPETEIFANLWETDDFNVAFTDTDNENVNYKYYQVLDYDGTEWRANKNNGFFNDNFESSINPDWTIPSDAGIWLINSGHLRQLDQSVSNSNIYTQLNQNDSTEYLYHRSALIDGLGTNRRCGLHIFVSDSILPNRGNSYLIWFLADQQKVMIYKTLNDTFYLKAENPININTAVWYDFKTIYNPVTGKIEAFIDNNSVILWTDSLPITSGKYLSLRNGDSDVQYDDIKVYKSRQDTAFITVGTNINDDIGFQNPNPLTPACKIKSIVTDSAGNFSVPAGLDVNIDWTPPDTGDYVYDGINTDIDTTNFQNQLSANWSSFYDINSEIKKYLYSIGISQQDTSIAGWTDNGLDTNITKNGLTLIDGQTYYFNIKAENNAALFSDIISSDGQTYIDTSDNINEFSSDFDLTVYPNPFNDNLIITYTLKKQEQIKISLTDILGREIIIRQLPDNSQKKGKYNINLNINELGIHKGTYLLRFSTKTKNINIHLVKY